MFLDSIFLQISNDTKHLANELVGEITNSTEYLANELVGEITNSTNSNNWIQIFLAGAVIATAFITFIYNRKTHNQTEREMKIRLRPVLARLHSMDKKSPKWDDKGWIEGESYRYNQKKLSIHFINNGALPATSISYSCHVELKDGDKSSDIIIENKSLPDLSVKEHYSIDIPWELVHYTEAIKGENCYFGLEVKYSANDSKESYLYSFEGYLKNQYLMIVKSNIT